MTIYLLEKLNDKEMHIEESLIADYCQTNGIRYTTMTLKQLRKSEIFKLKETYVPIGRIPFIKSAFKKMGIEIPYFSDYPDFFTVEDYNRPLPIKQRLIDISEDQYPLFIKPVELKKFNGQIADDLNAFLSRVPFNPKHLVWTSAPIQIDFEYRVYVYGKGQYFISDFNWDRHPPNYALIESWIQRMTNNGHENYSFDVGIHDDRHFIVEFNDAYSLGLYNIDKVEEYFEMLVNRFYEIVRGPHRVN